MKRSVVALTVATVALAAGVGEAAAAKSKAGASCRTIAPFGFSAGGTVVAPLPLYGAPFHLAAIATPKTCPRR